MELVYTLYDTPLSKYFKYLGVVVDVKFRWDIRIDMITSRAYKKLDMLKRALYGAPRRVSTFDESRSHVTGRTLTIDCCSQSYPISMNKKPNDSPTRCLFN